MVVMFLSVGSVFAAEDGKNFITNKVGVGYQGIFAGSLLSGISVRGWVNNNFGLEGTLCYGNVDVDDNMSGFNMDSDVVLFEAKAMYAPIVKTNSRFYVGAKANYGQLNVNNALGFDDEDFNMWGLGGFIGAEWNLREIPELGFNFDVGYTYLNVEDDSDNLDIETELDGTYVAFGIHYYF